MSNASERFDGILKIQGRTFHYVSLKEKDKTFVKVAGILFERNKKNNWLADINKTLEEKGLIQARSDAHDNL